MSATMKLDDTIYQSPKSYKDFLAFDQGNVEDFLAFDQGSVEILVNHVNKKFSRAKEKKEMAEKDGKKAAKNITKSVIESLKPKAGKVENIPAKVPAKKPKKKPSDLIITRTINVGNLVNLCLNAVEVQISTYQHDQDIEFSKEDRKKIIKAVKEKLKD